MQLTKQMPKLSVNKINLDFSDSETELPIEIRNDGKSTFKMGNINRYKMD